MRALLGSSFVLVPAAIALACSGGSAQPPGEDSGVVDPGDGGLVDAAGDAPPPGPTVTIATTTPLPDGKPANATLVAVTTNGTTWTVGTPKTVGVYEIEANARWTALVVCAGAGGESVHVGLYVQKPTDRKLDVTLDPYCLSSTATGAQRKLSGTFTNAPTTTGWIDFAYAKSARGSVVGVNGTSVDWEFENVEDGTWDLAFGLRDEAQSPLSRVLLRRAEAISADKVINVDLASGAPLGTKKLDVHGIVPGDSTTFRVAYTMSSELGIDLGPQLIPDTPDVALTYSTLDAALAKDTDRYRGQLVAESDQNNVAREVAFTFKTPVDIDTTLPAPLDAAPTVKAAATTPYLRLETSFPSGTAPATSYEISASERPNGKSVRIWSVMLPADAVAEGKVAFTMPDLSGLLGWSSEWTLPGQSVTVLARRIEPSVTLSDGTSTRSSRHRVIYQPE